MSVSTHVAKFIAAVSVHFPAAAKGDDGDLWLRSMDRVLRGMEPEVLALAAEIIIETRDPSKPGGRFFPAPRECIAACNEARNRMTLAKPRPLLAAPKGDDMSEDRIKFANILVQTEMGRQAAREGWVGTLWDFCRKQARLPTSEHEVAQCRRIAAEVDDLMAQIELGQFDAGALSVAVLKGCCRSIKAKREDIAGKAFGKGETVEDVA